MIRGARQWLHCIHWTGQEACRVALVLRSSADLEALHSGSLPVPVFIDSIIAWKGILKHAPDS